MQLENSAETKNRAVSARGIVPPVDFRTNIALCVKSVSARILFPHVLPVSLLQEGEMCNLCIGRPSDICSIIRCLWSIYFRTLWFVFFFSEDDWPSRTRINTPLLDCRVLGDLPEASISLFISRTKCRIPHRMLDVQGIQTRHSSRNVCSRWIPVFFEISQNHTWEPHVIRFLEEL